MMKIGDLGNVKLVKIRWVDSARMEGWSPLKAVLGLKPGNVTSIGWLLVDRSDYKVIVPHVSDPCSDEDTAMQGSMVIPTCAIHSMRTIRGD